MSIFQPKKFKYLIFGISAVFLTIGTVGTMLENNLIINQVDSLQQKSSQAINMTPLSVSTASASDQSNQTPYGPQAVTNIEVVPVVEVPPTPNASPAPAPKTTSPVRTASKPSTFTATPTVKATTTTNSPAPPPAPAPVVAPAPAACSGAYSVKLICLINQYRSSKGLGKLSSSGALSSVAFSHSSWMNSTGTFSHTGVNGSNMAERCRLAGTTCRGENLGYNSGTPENLMKMWIASSSHNANLLGSFSIAGIGISGGYVTLLLN